MTIDYLKNKTKNFPQESGVYIFKDSKKKHLYIGKAANLKSRVSSYLKTKGVRIQKMVSLAKSLEHIATSSDIEALIIESRLIKKFRPPFNIVMRDDKQYAFVGFTTEDYPKIFITHQPYKVKNKKLKVKSYIGPFTDVGALKTALRYLRRIFPYCTCANPHNNFCLNYHIGKCPGFCCLKQQKWITDFASRLSTDLFNPITENLQSITYKKNITAIKDILTGKKKSVIKNLEKEMTQSAKISNLEKAIELREKLGKLKRVFENAKIIRDANLQMRANNMNKNIESLKKSLGLKSVPRRIEGYDISNIQGAHATGSMVVFTNGQPDKNQYRKFKIHLSTYHDRGVLKSNKLPNDTVMLQEILERRFRHNEWPFPDLIVVDGGKGQVNAARAAISKSKFLISKQIQNPKFQIPIIGISKNERHLGHQLIIPGRKTPLPLTKFSPADKNLLLQIDFEAHRFAISYYRKLHRKLFR